MNNLPIDKVKSALNARGIHPVQHGDTWSANCPSHDDQHPSFGFGTRADGSAWVKCHKACTEDEILAALGLTKSALQTGAGAPFGPVFKASSKLKKTRVPFSAFEDATQAGERATGGEYITHWIYLNAGGVEAFRVARFNLPGGEPGEKPEKQFRPFHQIPGGWVMADPPGPLALYHLPEVLKADLVILCEGEKAADAARALGYTATTSAHGSQAVKSSDWSVLTGKTVIGFPDNDTAGELYIKDATIILHQLAAPAVVKVVHLPGLPPKGDFVEFIGARRAAGLDDAAIKAEVDALIAAAPIETPATSVSSVSASGGGNPEILPEPQPLPDALPPVMAFDPDFLPEAFRPWVVDIADRIQCPIDFPAVAAMNGLAMIVGRKVGIRPKREDDWTVVPNLWGAIIGRPGVMKTPGLVEPLKPIKNLEITAKKAFDSQMKASEASKVVAKIKSKDAENKIKGVLNDHQKAVQLAMESLPDDAEDPKRTRYIVNDPSVEKLGEILNQNPSGVLFYRDELIGFLKSLDKEGQEGARSFYLEAWNGTGRYTYDRIGRGTVDIEAAIISIIGGIQPGPLQQYLRAAAKEGAGDDGLIQRFQLMVWPDISKEWKNVDRKPNAEARAKARAVYDGLNELDADLIFADHDPDEPDGIPFLRFSEQAQLAFDAWRERLEYRVRSGDLQPSLESHLAKYRSLVPSLALLIHLADGGQGPVPLSCLQKALGWAEYLETHARRVYAQILHPDLAAARALGKKILAGQVSDGFDLRSVYRKGWSGLSTSEDAKGAADLLVDFDWLVAVPNPGDGRTGRTYRINPKLAGSAAAKSLLPPSKGTDKADGSPPQDPSVGSVSPSGGGNPDSYGGDGGWEVV